MARMGVRALVLAGILLAAGAARGQQTPSLVDQGYDALYNLDYDRAADLFHQAIAADPANPAAYRGAAKNAWLNILFLRGAMTADNYLGRISSSDVKMPPPPAQLADEFHRNIDRAVDLGEKEVERNFKSASAHYDLGAALGLVASYMGTIDGKVFGAMRAARRAFAEHEKVLELDPTRHEAGLVVGTYRYIVAALPMPVRWMAYIVGFGGGRDKAFRRLEEAADSTGDASADARTLLALLYNREHRYDDALRVVRSLERSFPRNRLLWLEEAGTALRARKPREAEKACDEGIARMRAETRPLMTGEAAQLHYKRGMARLLARETEGAAQDFKQALADATGPLWLRGRVHTEVGKLADLAGDRKAARAEYQTALALGEQSNDGIGIEEAKKLLNAPYRQ